MSMRFLLTEILLPLFVFLFLRAILKSIFQTRGPQRTPAANRQPPIHGGGELKKDPVCGIYVSTASSVTRKVRGELMYFCSEECRDKYHAA